MYFQKGGRGPFYGMGHGMMMPFERGGGRRHSYYCGREEMPEFFRKGSMAQTFRRGKILNFLERMFIRRNTLKHQLDQEEYKTIQPEIRGELKALEMVIDEFIHEFDLEEVYDSMIDEKSVNKKEKENEL
ncbi:hypothetical protein [Tepidibacillus marianensis]|uniref:hypothetical protein n=1 Tax=Tepidibacillus marianensis TaxID=3131995 RepID=UPI0030CE9032